MAINYISNLNVHDQSGGWSGMNYNVHLQLEKRFQINVIDQINPPYFFSERLFSKIRRVIGWGGCFPAFSHRRLNVIGKIVEKKLLQTAQLNFFHGSTSWVFVDSLLPYSIYLDASFASYINVYHNSAQFSKNHLDKLFEYETRFLTNAKAVFFSSSWALNDAKKQYSVRGDNFHVAGLGGGFCKSPNSITNHPTPYFLFVALDFYGKGGAIVVESFSQVKKKFPRLKLKIVGEKPPGGLLNNHGVEYLGFIDKSTEDGRRQLEELFSKAYCFLLPTSKDMTPLVLLEAASVGCPAITVKSFGIPELVIHNQTGILLEPGKHLQEALCCSMEEICSNESWRNTLGNNARDYVRKNFSWEKTGERIVSVCENLIQ